MAGVDVLCSDKTGTITKNELTIAEAQTFGKFEIDDAFLYGTLASGKKIMIQLMMPSSLKPGRSEQLPKLLVDIV